MPNSFTRMYFLALLIAGGSNVFGEPVKTNCTSSGTITNSPNCTADAQSTICYPLEAFEGKTIRVKLTDISSKKVQLIPIKPNQKMFEISKKSNGWYLVEIEEFITSENSWTVISAITLASGNSVNEKPLK